MSLMICFFLFQLLDKLESKMKGTCVEGTVPKLFEGKMVVSYHFISFIKMSTVFGTMLSHTLLFRPILKANSILQ